MTRLWEKLKGVGQSSLTKLNSRRGEEGRNTRLQGSVRLLSEETENGPFASGAYGYFGERVLSVEEKVLV